MKNSFVLTEYIKNAMPRWAVKYQHQSLLRMHFSCWITAIKFSHFFNRKNFGVMEFPRWVSCVHVLLVACLHIFKIRIARIWQYSIWKYFSLFETKSHSFSIFIEQYPLYHVPLYFLYECSSRKWSRFSIKKGDFDFTYITHHACEEYIACVKQLFQNHRIFL